MVLFSKELLMAVDEWCTQETQRIASQMGCVFSGGSRSFCVELGLATDGKMVRLSISVPSEANTIPGMKIEEMQKTYPTLIELALVHGENMITQKNLESLGYTPDVSTEVGYVDVEQIYSCTRASASENVIRLQQEVERLRELLFPSDGYMHHSGVDC
jgi:hypothetical protein